MNLPITIQRTLQFPMMDTTRIRAKQMVHRQEEIVQGSVSSLE